MVAKGVKYLKKQWCVLSQDANINDPKMEDNLKIACEGLTGCTTLGNIMGHLVSGWIILSRLHMPLMRTTN